MLVSKRLHTSEQARRIKKKSNNLTFILSRRTNALPLVTHLQLSWRNQLSNPVHNCYDVNSNCDLIEVFQQEYKLSNHREAKYENVNWRVSSRSNWQAGM
jgi:hypothetical protein